MRLAARALSQEPPPVRSPAPQAGSEKDFGVVSVDLGTNRIAGALKDTFANTASSLTVEVTGVSAKTPRQLLSRTHRGVPCP